jgi:hypothetical protein
MYELHVWARRKSNNLPEAEEVLDLSVTGRASDVLNLNGAWRSHDVGCVCDRGVCDRIVVEVVKGFQSCSG